jgi:hypothetical protein
VKFWWVSREKIPGLFPHPLLSSPRAKKDHRASFSQGVRLRPSIGLFQFEPHGEKEKTMHTKGRFPNVFFGPGLRLDSAALAILVLLLFLIFVFLFLTLMAQPAQAQNYQGFTTSAGAVDSSAFPLTISTPRNSLFPCHRHAVDSQRR